MSRQLAWTIVAAIGFGAIVLAFSTGHVSRGGSPSGTSNVQISASTEDGRELFRLQLFEPWKDAGHRVVVLGGACVTNSGLAALGTYRTLDSTLGADPVTLRGERHTVSVVPRQGTWSAVAGEDDLVVTLAANN